MTDESDGAGLNGGDSETDKEPSTTGSPFDAVELEILRTQLESVATEMGTVLVRGAYSPNITERRDCSTALFDADGRLVAQAEHIPVHLGAMPAAVAAVRERDPVPGDVFILNDPYHGGTHLPDITLVSPIAPAGRILGYAVSRAHHADVGGSTPGSMPAGARDIHEEGIRLPPVRYLAAGERNETVERCLLDTVRNPRHCTADLRAQRAANRRGARRFAELCADHGTDRFLAAFDAVIEYSRDRVAAALGEMPDGTYRAADVLEGDGVTEADIPIEVAVDIAGETATVDFAGTAPQVAGNLNAPPAVTRSAVYFAFRCVTDPGVPTNQGCYDPLTVVIPEGSLLDPRPPAAVVGGNVETSQRVVDVVFSALESAAPDRVPAQGQGTMNNLVIGASTFSYYETVGGGAGATPDGDGRSGVHVGMTNTLNTPVEALEQAYPLHVEEYALRRGSGGDGRFAGGDGLVRSVRLLEAATVSLLTERRRHAPAGVGGGTDGTPGRNLIDGEEVPAKVTRDLAAGSTVTLETPGGGGYGEPD